MKKTLCFTFILACTFIVNAQIVVIDAGHGYNQDCSNGDWRSPLEINTSYEVSVRLKNLLDQSCNWTTHLTRPTNDCGSWISLAQRYTMANNWNADVFLSVHCNAGGGTGTETFWCDLAGQPNIEDEAYATEIQDRMAEYGDWTYRRVVEDDSYLNFHLGVLKNLDMHGCLSEIGFVDFTADSIKLLDSEWRDNFVLAYYTALQNFLGINCNESYLCDISTPINCDTTITMPISDDPSIIQSYGCNNWTETGPERVHSLTLVDTQNIAATISDFYGDLDVYLLSECNPDSCIGSVYSYSTYFVDAPPGTYYIVVDADDGSGSGYELTLHCNPLPDLTIYGFDLESNMLVVDEYFNLSADVYNYSALPVDSVYTNIYISEDSVLSAEDVLVWSFFDSMINPVSAVEINNLIPVPELSEGNYYILIVVDPFQNITETNEQNNMVSIPIEISLQTTVTISNDFSKNHVLVFPNPTNEFINIQFDLPIQVAQMHIMDIKGSLIETKALKNSDIFTLDISPYKNGIYMLHVISDNINFQGKIIKN